MNFEPARRRQLTNAKVRQAALWSGAGVVTKIVE
jgi:hypothetical protein